MKQTNAQNDDVNNSRGTTNKTSELLNSSLEEQVRQLTAELEEIRQEKNLIKTALNTQLDTFFLFDINTGKAIYWNEQFRKISGYTDKEIASLKAPDSYFSAKDVKKASAAIKSFLKKGGGSVELSLVCKDGRTIPYEYFVSVIEDKQKNPQYLISIGRDISERKQAESMLHKTRFSIEHSTDQIFWIDPDGNFIDVNEAVINSLGYTKEELLSMGVKDIVTGYIEDYTKIWTQRWNALKENKNMTFESQHICNDGHIIPVEVTINYTEYEGQELMCAIARDITERKKAEETIKESEAKFKALTENSNDAIMRFDREHRHLYANPIVEKQTGYKPEEFIGKTHREMGFPEDLVALCESAIDKVFETGKNNRIEFSLPNGIYIDWLLTPEFSADGEVVVVMTSARDITERKLVEKAQFETIARFSGFAEASQYGMGIANLDGNIVYVNPTLVRMLGEKSEEDCLGKNLLSYYPPLITRKLQEEVMPALMEKGNWHGELEILSVDGRSIPTDENYFVILDEDGKPLYLANIMTDITERKQTEAALRESEEKYRAFFENSFDPMQMLRNGQFFDINAATVKSLRYDSKEELYNTPPWVLSPEFQPDGRQSEEKAHEMINIALEKGTHRFEWDHLCKDGTVLPVEVSLTLIPYKEGQTLLSTWRDISYRKSAEEERQKLQEQLFQSQKMEAIGRLAGGVAHDFNNMLGAIIGYTEMLLDQIDDSHSMYSDLQEIYKAAERSADLTRQLLAFARKQTADPLVLDLNEIIASSLKMLQRLIGEEIKLVWQPGNNLWPVKMDPTQINQILANLCVNARDAIEGVGTIIIETANITIEEIYATTHSYVEPGDYTLLAVSDDGFGINKETLENIFEPFFTTKELGQGTGLGLSTVYGIMKQNNGFINVYSEKNYGTTFKMFFPRYKVEDGQSQEVVSEEKIAHGSETILLIEDEQATLNVTKKMLERLGYNVLTATTPDEAIRQAKNNSEKIKLVITDVIMPEMNGRTLIEILTKQYPHLKRLYMSGYTADVIAHHGVLEKGINFIQKPISLRELAKKVREVLDKN